MLKFITNAQKKYRGEMLGHQWGSTPAKRKAEYEKWRSHYLEMDPRATEEYSSAELKAMGLAGLYKQVDEI